MSKRSPAWADSSPSSTASASSSPASKSSGYYSAASSSSMSKESSPRKSLKRKTSETSESHVPDLDLQMSEEFLKAEEELKNDHVADYQVFLDVPEVHPDYSSNFESFMKQFSKRYGDDDPARCKELWETFWYEIVNEKQEQEWKTKKTVLIKQFQIKSITKEKHHKRLKDIQCSDKHSRSEKIRNSEKTQDVECIDLSNDDADEKNTGDASSSDGYPTPGIHNFTVPSSRHETERTPSNVGSSVGPWRNEVYDRELAKNVSLTQSLDLLEDVCDSLGDIFSSVLRRVIKKMKDFESDKEIISFLDNKDTKKLLCWASGKLKSLSTEAVGAERSKLIHCSKIAVKLIEYGTEGTWNQKYGGLNLNNVAAATYNKDVSATLGIIKESLRYSGIDNPTQEVVNNVFAEVSLFHLNMTLDK